MKPYLHAMKSAKKYGGQWQDYIELHNWFDQTKQNVPDVRHRLILHNAFGIFLLEKQFGITLKNSAGRTFSVRDVGEDHVLEDLGTIPTLEKCLSLVNIEAAHWLGGRRIKTSNKKKIHIPLAD